MLSQTGHMDELQLYIQSSGKTQINLCTLIKLRPHACMLIVDHIPMWRVNMYSLLCAVLRALHCSGDQFTANLELN